MRTFNVRFKRKVVRDYFSGKGGYKILAAKYDIADSCQSRSEFVPFRAFKVYQLNQ